MVNHITDYKNYANCHFDFSRFQTDACDAIVKNQHVLVTAHTGSGKTLPAEFAIYYTTQVMNKKIIYTSPIKALSNQKFQEFTKKFPNISVGILTGDIKHNPDAQLLIMTTEILQNHCFKINHDHKYLDFNMDLQKELGCVIFDEVHYIDDPDRGTVWEQCMIMLPDHIPFVMLSATIGEKEVFANWIRDITSKDVRICSTNHRVVPLQFVEFFTTPNKYIENIKDKKKKQLFLEKTKSNVNVIKTQNSYDYSVLNTTKKCMFEIKKDDARIHQKFVINECLENMKNNDRFPCLCFVFSRKQVENIASQITCNLFMEEEKDYCVEPIFRQMLVSKVNNWKEYMELPEYNQYLDLLEKGIGIHHAGMLPIFREMIEILYDQKYIKVLVATETFAIGLNMPTRSVIFSSIYKHDGNKRRLLKSHEFIQMAGRAGRRNIDTVGYVYLLTNLFEPLTENEYYNLFHSTPKILKSKFKIGYNLILNFMNNLDEEKFEKMIKNSMMNLDIKKQINRSLIEIKNNKSIIERYRSSFEEREWDVIEYFNEYYEIDERMKYANNKMKKQLMRRKSIMEQDKNKMSIKSSYDMFVDIVHKNKKELKMLEYATNFIKDTVKSIYNILYKNGFIDDEKKLTNKGICASYIHEIPCLPFMDFYDEYLKDDKLSEINILSILSCFYSLKVRDDEKTNVPEHCKEELKFIVDKTNTYIDAENAVEMYITPEDTIQYDLMYYIREWYQNVFDADSSKIFFNKIKQENTFFVGDFMKASMKIVNMINEIKIVCEYSGNFSVMEKLNNIQNNIQKNIVSNKSLYV
jgi:antiviral helicase SKI2